MFKWFKTKYKNWKYARFARKLKKDFADFEEFERKHKLPRHLRRQIRKDIISGTKTFIEGTDGGGLNDGEE